jgi:hypothetical protein
MRNMQHPEVSRNVHSEKSVEKEFHTYCANINSTKMWIKTPLMCGKTYSTHNVGKCFPRKCGNIEVFTKSVARFAVA